MQAPSKQLVDRTPAMDRVAVLADYQSFQWSPQTILDMHSLSSSDAGAIVLG
jgi:hypothetical protein